MRLKGNSKIKDKITNSNKDKEQIIILPKHNIISSINHINLNNNTTHSSNNNKFQITTLTNSEISRMKDKEDMDKDIKINSNNNGSNNNSSHNHLSHSIKYLTC
jgi:hypothetical protein